MYSILLVCASIAQLCATGLNHIKPIRFDHGSPIIMRIGTECLVLEFEAAPRGLVDERSYNTFKVKAPYRLKTFELASKKKTFDTSGHLFEYYRFKKVTRSNGKVTSELTDLGSNEHLKIGAFSLGWSNGGSGKSSWLYFNQSPQIQFIQQVENTLFEELNAKSLSSIIEAQNIFKLNKSDAYHVAIGTISTRALYKKTHPRIIGITRQGRVTGLILDGLQIGTEYSFQRSNSAKHKKWHSAGSFIAESDSQVYYPSQDGSAINQFFRLCDDSVQLEINR